MFHNGMKHSFVEDINKVLVETQVIILHTNHL
jgi:hypothetical protein